jgi:hypothetical protein
MWGMKPVSKGDHVAKAKAAKLEVRRLIYGALVLLILLALFTQQARAGSPGRRPHSPPPSDGDASGNGAQIGRITYAGNGCPKDSVAVSLSPDRRTVSLLFDKFVAEAANRKLGNTNIGAVVKKNCVMQIPLVVPKGVQARMTEVDLRGFMSLPANSSGKLRGKVFIEIPLGKGLVGRPIGGVEHQLTGPYEDSYELSQLPDELSEKSWTPCGRSVDVRVESHVVASASPALSAGESAIITIDSADIVSEDTTMKVGLEWRPCRNNR